MRVKLREMMDSYERSTGERLTYALIAERTGVSVETLQSIATRATYNTRLSTIVALCYLLKCEIGELVDIHGDGGKENSN